MSRKTVPAAPRCLLALAVAAMIVPLVHASGPEHISPALLVVTDMERVLPQVEQAPA